MALRASPSWACQRVSRIRSLAGMRPELAGHSAAPPACTEGSGPCAPHRPTHSPVDECGTPSFRLLDGRLLDERLRLAVQVPRLGRRGGGHGPQQCCGSDELLARSRGVSGLSTLKSVLMRSRACLPNSRARSPRADASPAIEARSNRTVWYSSASLASSSRAWASCALMSAPLGGEGGGVLGPAARRGPVPRAGGTSLSPAPAA
jgi:hypothetical protein